MKGKWLFGVRVRKIGKTHYLSTRQGAKSQGVSREEAMLNFVFRDEAGRKEGVRVNE